MDKIIFGTTNEGKLTEAQSILGIDVEGVKLDVPEIQSLDQVKVATAKAKAYFQQLQTPLFIEDTGLIFTSLNGLPGAYTADFSKALGNEGLIKLLYGFTDHSATAITVLAFVDSHGQVHIFTGTVQGSIAPAPVGDLGFGWDPIFIPNGYSKTFAQMTAEEKNNCSMRRLALEQLKNHLSK